MRVWIVAMSSNIAPDWAFETWRHSLEFALVEVEELLEMAEEGDICARALAFQIKVPFWVLNKEKYIRDRQNWPRESQGFLSQNCTGACEREEAWPSP